ncbi:gluconate 2-dehydrogenase subunit 3 family protein [Dokdonia sp.]|uniref:gluconate 2-dehydrogenase subunit 3 family protein n=1 Tax=Dokdonia sp. TaxID=2024995 RepID=UPI003267E340
MDRRKSIQTMLLGAGAISLGLHSCVEEGAPELDQQIVESADGFFGRTPEELERIEKLNAEQLFTEHELETIAILSEVILPPKPEVGGPLEAGVPEFIEFIGKDMPRMQNTLLGGLLWLDNQSLELFNTPFKSLALAQQKQILDSIAFYDHEIPSNKRPFEIQWFSLMRNLTMTGYYTSEWGIKDLGYKGNQPNVWDGVPQDVLDQHGVAYDPEWIAKCIDQNTRGDLATWDEHGNLLT